MAADIRPARASDVDALLAIENAVFETDRLTRSSLRRLTMSGSAAVIVAEVEASVAGYCILLLRKGAAAARLYSLAVGPGHSGRGIGRMLVKAAEREALARGRRSLRLEVREDNPRAVAIYRQAGFIRTGSRPGYYQDGMAAICMNKLLVEAASAVTGDRAKETSTGSASFSRLTEKTPRRASL
ncbi:MAG: N-acetyltransferase [Hyphomicrobiales bacterium]|nr:N-acetyltransferase [Hyphomicrobiales bacterium]